MPSNTPIRLVVIFGGESAEHDVSCSTAVHVLAAIDPARYEVTAVGITRDGQWVEAREAAGVLNRGDRPLPAQIPAEGPGTELAPLLADSTTITVVLPLLHGPRGEDGTIQGLLEMANVPYVGAGVLGSALAMDKAKAKEVLAGAGVPQTRWVTCFEPTWDGNAQTIVDQLGLPVFVKPANMGSSVGVSKARTVEQLRTALEVAFDYDEWVVVEEAVTAREIEFAVLGNTELSVSCPGEIVPGAEFYDYEDKYSSGTAQLHIPAQLDDDVVAEMQQLAQAAYRALRVEGLARADFFYEEGGRGPLLNELNTMPGFTPISMYPKLWAASGLTYPELIDRLVELAIERHTRRAAKRRAK